MKKGFSLLECLVVLSCVALTIGCAFFMYENCITFIQAGHKKNDSLLQVYTAALLIMRDYSRAIATAHDMWTVTSNSCIWPVKGGHCGYTLNKGRLIRSCGTYNKTMSMWHVRTQALVATDILSVAWVLDAVAGVVRGVRCCVATQYEKTEFYCSCGVLCI